MAGHYKLLTSDKQVFARGTEAEMVSARTMHTRSKGKLMGSTMTIEFDPIDYPFRGKDEPQLGLRK